MHIGLTSSLSARLSDHEREACATWNGATHIHAHATPGGELSRREEENDLPPNWNPVCNGCSSSHREGVPPHRLIKHDDWVARIGEAPDGRGVLLEGSSLRPPVGPPSMRASQISSSQTPRGSGGSNLRQAFRGVRPPFGAILDRLVNSAYRIAVKVESMRTLTAKGISQPIDA